MRTDHDRSLTMFICVILMLAAAAIAVTGAMVIHRANAAELQPPANSWVIVGEVRAIDQPELSLDLGRYFEDSKGQPARSMEDAHVKTFQTEEDCKVYLDTDVFKNFQAKIQKVADRMPPPGRAKFWCRRDGEPA